MDSTSKRLRLLLISTIASWVAIAMLAFAAFTHPGAGRADDANREPLERVRTERLDIVSEDGEPVLVLANRRLMPGPVMDGREYPPEVAEPRPYVSGMIFYNEEGDEVGGLIYNGMPRDSGYTAVGHLSFDQWKQNQVVALQYIDDGRTRRSGLRVWDRPVDVSMARQLDLVTAYREATSETERDSLAALGSAWRERGDYGAERLFVGSQDREARVELRDPEGRVRARLVVDEDGDARLEFLNEEGEVTRRVPR